MRIPNHIGIIPDGNRRWAEKSGYTKEQGYSKGLTPGLTAFKTCRELGVKEITFYGFTVDNTKRPSTQRLAFTQACVEAVHLLMKEDAELLVLGNTLSPMFPTELLPYTTRKIFGKGGLKVNFLVNYSWEWDLGMKKDLIPTQFHSTKISRVDLVIRWGGRSRLSGFLPLQSVYSDFYFLEEYWPDYKDQHILDALNWYKQQDVTLGG